MTEGDARALARGVALSDAEKEKARLSPGCAGLVRAAAKEFATGDDAYAKGEGNKAFAPWLGREDSPHLKGLVVKIDRAEKDSRFDIETRAAWALYYNQPVLEEFVSTRVRAHSLRIRARALFPAVLRRHSGVDWPSRRPALSLSRLHRVRRAA